MSTECPRCPRLMAEVHNLRTHARWLEEHIEFLQIALSSLIGAVNGVIAFITREQTQPSMPRQRLIPAVNMRLTAIVDDAQGRRP